MKAGEHIGNSDYDLMAKYAIDFAKLHVEVAVETISKKVKLLDDMECWNNCSCEHPCKIVDKNSILNAYPLTLIK